MKLRHRVGRRLRAWLERASGRFYEGPEPPARYAERARVHALSRPDAEGWERFAAELAELAYREGYVRGLERRERMPEMVLALGRGRAEEEEELRHGWSLASRAPQLSALLRAADPNDPLAALPNDAARMAALEAQGVQTGAFKVVYFPVERGELGSGDGS